MSAHRQTPPVDSGFSMGETVTSFLSSLPAGSSSQIQQEVFKFIRWYGEERAIASLTGQEVANYSEQLGTATTKSIEHLNAVKALLQYAYKKGLTSLNLSTHIRVKKLPVKRSTQGSIKTEEPVMLTQAGYDEMQARLASLREERPRVTEEIRRAAADKDFRENAPLEAAREKQGHIDGQIHDLEETLKKAKIIKTMDDNSLKISVGDSVALTDVQSGEVIIYTLVSSSEANIKQGKISMASPMGQALFNKETGETLEVKAPSGVLTYRIVEITKH